MGLQEPLLSFPSEDEEAGDPVAVRVLDGRLPARRPDQRLVQLHSALETLEHEVESLRTQNQTLIRRVDELIPASVRRRWRIRAIAGLLTFGVLGLVGVMRNAGPAPIVPPAVVSPTRAVAAGLQPVEESAAIRAFLAPPADPSAAAQPALVARPSPPSDRSDLDARRPSQCAEAAWLPGRVAFQGATGSSIQSPGVQWS